MKNLIVILFSIIISFSISAQSSGNVGIEIDQPENRLHVHDSIVNVIGEPPFQFTQGEDNFIQVTNGVSGTAENDGLLMGLNLAGGAEIKHPFNLEIQTGQAGITLTDATSQVAVIGDMRVTSLGGEGTRSLLADAQGNVIAQMNPVDQFSRFQGFQFNGQWVVPTNINLVKIELWGGGGLGGFFGGGGGGAFATGILDVNPGDTLNITIGLGSTNFGGSGGISTVSRGSDFISAYGGSSADINRPGWGGTTGLVFGFNSFLSIPGINGSPRTTAFDQKSETEFVAIIDYGRGGGTFRNPNAGGIGEISIEDPVTGSVSNRVNRTPAVYPGGGGGGSQSAVAGWGQGANGYVIIYW